MTQPYQPTEESDLLFMLTSFILQIDEAQLDNYLEENNLIIEELWETNKKALKDEYTAFLKASYRGVKHHPGSYTTFTPHIKAFVKLIDKEDLEFNTEFGAKLSKTPKTLLPPRHKPITQGLRLALNLHSRREEFKPSDFSPDHYIREISGGQFIAYTSHNPKTHDRFDAIITNLDVKFMGNQMDCLDEHTFKVFNDITLADFEHIICKEIRVLFKWMDSSEDLTLLVDIIHQIDNSRLLNAETLNSLLFDLLANKGLSIGDENHILNSALRFHEIFTEMNLERILVQSPGIKKLSYNINPTAEALDVVMLETDINESYKITPNATSLILDGHERPVYTSASLPWKVHPSVLLSAIKRHAIESGNLSGHIDNSAAVKVASQPAQASN